MKTTQSRLLCLGIAGGVVLFVGVMALTAPAGATSPPPSQYYDLNMTINPIGGGHVTPSPDPGGGTFNGTPNSWVETYLSGTNVALSAVPRVGHMFDHWEGDLSGIANRANLTMNSPKNVTAVFCPVNAGPPPEITLAHNTVAPAADGTTPSTRLTVGVGEFVDVSVLAFHDTDRKCEEDVSDSREPLACWEVWLGSRLIYFDSNSTENGYCFGFEEVGSYTVKYFADDRNAARGTTEDPSVTASSDGLMWAAIGTLSFNVVAPDGVRFLSIAERGFGEDFIETDWADADFIGACDVVVNQLLPKEVSFNRCRVKETFRPDPPGVLTLGPFPNGLELQTSRKGDSPVGDDNSFPDLLKDGLISKFVLISKDEPHDVENFIGSVPGPSETWCLEWKLLSEDDNKYRVFKNDMALTTVFYKSGRGQHGGYTGGTYSLQGPWKCR